MSASFPRLNSVGATVGAAVVGMGVGAFVGCGVGAGVGGSVGAGVGTGVGCRKRNTCVKIRKWGEGQTSKVRLRRSRQ